MDCPEGKVRNPQTNRCRKRSQTKRAVKELKSCEEGKTRNPQTNRCRKRSQAKRKSRSPKKASLKKASPRLLKRTTIKSRTRNIKVNIVPHDTDDIKEYGLDKKKREGFHIIRNKVVYPMTSSSLSSVVRKYGPLSDILPKNYQLYKKMGEGSFGTVYLACNDEDGNCNVIKIQEVHAIKEIENEVDMQRKFNAVGLAPKIISVRYITHRGTRYAVIEMGRIHFIYEKLIESKQNTKTLDDLTHWVLHITKKMCKHNLTHGDLHTENIGAVYENGELKPMLIDFGWASTGKCHPDLELIQMMRTLYFGRMNHNKRYIIDKLYTYYTEHYNKNLKNSDPAFEKEWNKLMDSYASEQGK